jgi:hypothetical protein
METSRGPQHFAGPPRNESDITQIKKIRQCVFAMGAMGRMHRLPGEEAAPTKIKQVQELLALGKSCGRLPPFTTPLFCFWGFQL